MICPSLRIAPLQRRTIIVMFIYLFFVFIVNLFKKINIFAFFVVKEPIIDSSGKVIVFLLMANKDALIPASNPPAAAAA